MRWRQAVEELVPLADPVLCSEHLSLAPEPRNVGVARRFVSRIVAGDPDRVDVVELLTSELVTNAVIHARTQLEVAVVLTEHLALVMVHDEDLGRQEVLTHDRDGGRGLGLVEALSASCGMTSHGLEGKTAWFTVAVDHTSARAG